MITKLMNDSSNSSITPGIQPPLAIVGISALFPKASSTDEFWSNIRRGVDAITEVPASHWNPDDYFDPNQKTPDMTYARRGGFLSPLPFDPLEFGISPNNLEAIDTSQLLGLVGAKRALEHAGYGAGRTFDRSRVGCILGVTGTLEMVIPLGARLGHPRWRQALKDAGVADDVAEDVVKRISESYVPWQENSFPGLLGNVVAGRIANRLDLHGTNCVVDAACASSLSAIHLAALELWTGRSDMVVTGGIDTFNDIFMYMCFSKTPALSPSGDAKPFSDESDGTILGEGVGIVVLKRLADAERDGDRVFAVLKGIGTSSDGAGNAVYAPKAEGQIRCLQDAYRVSGVSPQTVELVEAHGTGTKVGDATEVSGLMQVYGAAGRRKAWCAVGSIKSQIGHTKAAAGSAGVIKAILALQHRVLPPTIKVNRPPAALLADDSPFYVNTEARPWLKPVGHPRRAAVSAFGFGGSNFHCVLEESPQRFEEPDWDGDVQVIALSAGSLTELTEAVKSRITTLVSAEWSKVRTSTAKFRAEFDARHPQRLLLVLERDKTDLAKLVASTLTMLERYPDKESWSTPDGAYYGRGAVAGKLGFLFPGQGSQYVGMLRELTCRFPLMNDVLSEANEVFENTLELSSLGTQRLSDYIYPHPSFTAEGRTEHEAALRATQIAQPAIGAVSLAVLGVMDEFGIEPQAVAGHSYGELTALCASRRFAPRVLYRLSMLRGQLMAAAQDLDGGMLALGAPLTQIEAALKELSVDLVVANHNSPTQVVLSGRIPEIERANALFANRNIRGKKLAVAAAFHSPMVAPASRAFRPVLDEVEFAPSRMPVYANSTATEYPSDPAAARDLLAAQLARPVNFVKEIERMHADGVRTFLEVGPGAVLTGLVNSILSGRDYRAIAVDSSSGKRSGMFDLATALAQLAAAGYAVSWEKWDPISESTVSEAASKRMQIPICGANYVKPRAPIPPRKIETRTEVPTPVEAVKATLVPAASAVSTVVTSEGPMAQPKPVPSVPATNPQSKEQRFTGSTVPIVKPVEIPLDRNDSIQAPARTASDNGQTRETIRQTLEILQRMQEETTKVHQQFLDSQEIAFKTFERLAAQQLSGRPLSSAPATNESSVTSTSEVTRTSSAIGSTSIPSQPLQQQRVSVTPPVPHEIDESTDTRIAALSGWQQVKPSTLPSNVKTMGVSPESVTADIVPAWPTVEVAPRPVLQHSIVEAAPIVANVPQAATAASPQEPVGSGLSSIVLDVVAEKTGYPTAMLSLEMSLDHDLGIDSIKRVEILSTLQERVRNLPAFQPDELGSLHTLNDVVNLAVLRSAKSSPDVKVTPAASSYSVPPAISASTASIGPVSVPASPNAEKGKLGPVVLEVVAEKTGYPAEMLHLDMSLDHDLGIDSIKRVEILSALQERVPSLPAFQPEELGSLHTLRDVVSLADARTVGSLPVETAPPAATVAAISAGNDSPVPASHPELPSAVVRSHERSLGPTVLAVVSEKTGYPAEMLNLDMSLDHDLGIDSIKRVEILSALQERIPELPAFQPEELGSLHTLRDVLQLADERLGGTSQSLVTEAPQLPTVTQDHVAVLSPAPSAPLAPVVLQIVAEKTGYPVEMLNLEMSLDHDLGIDSIKRVEILSALQERVPHLPAFQPEELGALHTLQDVVSLADRRSETQSRLVKPSITRNEGAASVQGTDSPPTAIQVTRDLGPVVLEVVSEKTGYPTEMLNLDMSLDHDLGIDSIKRVEILSALQERVADLPAFQPEELGALHTLRDVVGLANARMTATLPVAQHPHNAVIQESVPVTPTQTLNRSVVRCETLPSASVRPLIPLAQGSEIWVTDDGSDLSLRIADELKKLGFQLRLIPPQAPSSISATSGLSALIVVAPQQGATSDSIWNAVRWLQLAGPSLRQTANRGPALFATVSRLDGRFGFESQTPLIDPTSGGLAGIAKCAAREWPEVVSRAFDLGSDWSSNQSAARKFVEELMHEGPTETGVSSTQTVGLKATEVPVDSVAVSRPINAGDVVIVSGGARGVTAEAALALARAWQPRLVILGRNPEPVAEPEWLSPLSSEAEIKQALIRRSAAGVTPKAIQSQTQQILASREIARQLSRLRSIGVSAHYFSVDVRDESAIQQIVTRVQREWGPVRGIIHGAGVLADQKIEDKTREQFERVYQTKILGIESLLSCINVSELKVLGLFSSYTARFGRIGQIDYAIANEVLNKMARQFAASHPQCRVASFNWGPWDGGMVQGGLKQLFAAEGVDLIPLEAGAKLLVQELEQSSHRPVEVLILGKGSDLSRSSEPVSQAKSNGAQPAAAAASPRPEITSGPATTDREKGTDLKVALEITLDAAKYPFLNSHVIGGKAVLPVAVILEWMAHAAIHHNPGLELRGFSEFRVFQGIRVGTRDQAALKVMAGRSVRSGDQFVSRVQVVSNVNGREVLHAGGNVVMSSAYGSAPTAQRPLHANPYSLDVAAAYDRKLFHGPLLHAITSIDGSSEEGIVVKSRSAPLPSTWMSNPVRSVWLADPLVIDAALQAVILWSQEMRNKPCLPCAVKSYQQFRRSFPKDGVRIEVRVTEGRDQLIRCHVEFTDNQGQVVARMEGCESVADASLVAAFARRTIEG